MSTILRWGKVTITGQDKEIKVQVQGTPWCMCEKNCVLLWRDNTVVLPLHSPSTFTNKELHRRISGSGHEA